MKFTSIVIITTSLMCFKQLCKGQGGTIVGSRHDFAMAATAWNFNDSITSQLQSHICHICHATMHSSNGQLIVTNYTDSAGMPIMPGLLWDHHVSSAGYKIYSEGYNFWKYGGTTIGNPDGSSKLCLSCHDGTVAAGNFRMILTGNMGTEVPGDPPVIGRDLSRSHPISFTYDGRLASMDRKLNDPMMPSGVRGGSIDDDMLEDHKVQCISCHDPHNLSNGKHLLVKTTANGWLCFTCHKM